MPNPPLRLNCWLCFPFNPYKKDFYKVVNKKISPLVKSLEVKSEDEIWRFFSNDKIGWDDIRLQIEAAGKEINNTANFFGND